MTMPPQQDCPDQIETKKDVLKQQASISGIEEQHVLEARPRIDAPKHTLSTLALCLTILSHSYLLISVFPYSGFMAIHLIPSLNEETTGSYAGLISASFMLGRAFSSYAWGKLADRHGRVSVLLTSLGLSCLFTILFGIAPSFVWALTFRCLLGLGNGLVGTVKTCVSELAGGNQKLETRAMGIVMGCWGWGFLFSPALSGALAEPVRQYPDNAIVEQYQGVLSAYPFLLPNLVGAVFCLFSMAMVKAFVHETLPADKKRSWKMIPRDILDYATNLVLRLGGTREEQLPIMNSSPQQRQYQANYSSDDNEVEEYEMTLSGEIHDVRLMKPTESSNMLCTETGEIHSSSEHGTKHQEPVEEATLASLWARLNTRNHLLVQWSFSFLSISVDEAFPLFCVSKEAGLGLSELSIGQILSGSGLIYAFCQYFVYSTIVNKHGIYDSIKIGSIISAPIIAFIPVSLLLNRGLVDGELTWTTFIFLSGCLAGYRVFASVFFASMSIATNRTVPDNQRATMNGLAMLGGSAMKGLGPAFAGVLFAFSVSSGMFPPHVGAVLVFFIIALFGVSIAISTFYVLRPDDHKQVEVR